jgi:hypothetical protein
MTDDRNKVWPLSALLGWTVCGDRKSRDDGFYHVEANGLDGFYRITGRWRPRPEFTGYTDEYFPTDGTPHRIGSGVTWVSEAFGIAQTDHIARIKQAEANDAKA